MDQVKPLQKVLDRNNLRQFTLSWEDTTAAAEDKLID